MKNLKDIICEKQQMDDAQKQSIRDKIKQAMADDSNTWVAIKDTHITNKEGHPIKNTKYHVVQLKTFKRLDKGVKIVINKQTGRPEEVAESNPHKIQELGRASSQAEAKKFLPNIITKNNN